MKTGDKAPDFELPDQTGTPRKLSDYLAAGPVVLFFYPAAMTPGCTKESCHFRDLEAEFGAVHAQRLGISADPVDKQHQFADKYGLDFTLLGDPDHEVAEAYGTWVEKSMYGKKYMGVQRDTFVIDAGGNVARILRKVQPKTHDDVVLEALGSLAAA